MKATFCVLTLLASLGLSHAQDCVSADGGAVCYSTPVVYQSAVVYKAPVTYYAPVYYLSAAAAAACNTACPPAPCSSPSTVIHITNGRGVYVTSNCDGGRCSGSSVVYIGGQYARQSGNYARPAGFHFGHWR